MILHEHYLHRQVPLVVSIKYHHQQGTTKGLIPQITPNTHEILANMTFINRGT